MSEGELLIGNCKLLTCLATGNQTQVWEVVEQGSNEKYAMKLLLPEAFKDVNQKNALKHEANVLKSLEHPNIVKFKNFVMDKKVGFLLMELFRAPNLKSQIQNDLLSVHVRLKRLIEQVSGAMAHIHDKGWLHKDLKPDNILFSKAAELRVIDFSLSSKIPTGFLSFGKKKVIQGTRTYMAPEQIRGQRLGPYTDIYNFGITVFEMLTGRTPFAGFTPNDLLKRHLTEACPYPSSFNQNITPEMDRVVLKMLAKKPDQRQKTFNELLSEIRNLTLFKEDPSKLIEQKLAEKESESVGEGDQNLSKRRDSRSDAKRAEMAKAAAEEAAANPPPAASPRPIQIPGGPPAAGQPPRPAPLMPVPPGMIPPPPRPGQPPAPVPPGGPAANRPPQSIPVGMPPRPGMPPLPPPPGARPPMPPGGPPRPGMPPPPGLPPGAMPPPPRPMPPAGAPRPPGAPLPPPGVTPPGMPPRPGVPAVAAGPGAPPRPMPPGAMPPPPRPGGPGLPPGALPPPPGLPRPPMPAGMRPSPPGPGARPPVPPPPRPAPPPPSGDLPSLDDLNVS